MARRRNYPIKYTALIIGLFLIIGAWRIGMSQVRSKTAVKDRVRAVETRAQEFLDLYDSLYVGTYTATQEAQWLASTDVTPEHDGQSAGAGKVRQRVLGDRRVIETARRFLAEEKSLKPLTVRRLRYVILAAAEGPGTIPEITTARIDAETRQASKMNAYQYEVDGKPVSANDIDRVLQKSIDLNERRKVWEASKKMGTALKPGLVELRDLRNKVARALGYSSYWALQVARYDMTPAEMLEMLASWRRDLKPLYDELYKWTARKLATKYRQPAPKKIPAHWINNRWSQNWTGLVEAANLDKLFADKKPEWLVRKGEEFYVSMGFPPLPQTFWDKSDLYPAPLGPDGKPLRKKNAHASAWDINLANDWRSLQSIEPDEQWWHTVHHEFGHIYYFSQYDRPEVPPILRDGANPGFHEGMGELISLVSGQTRYLRQMGVLPVQQNIAVEQTLLNSALAETVPFIYWSAGTMPLWEHDIYEKNLPIDQWQSRWWEYVEALQGIAPPDPQRANDPNLCDAASKTHINDTPAYYQAYAFATVLKHQLHDHIARKILKQDPHDASYFGNKEVGEFLRGIMRQGATRPWREVLEETTGEKLSTRAIVEYYRPLLEWLKKENSAGS